MATGESKTRWNGELKRSTRDHISNGNGEVRLTYEGKKPECAILERTPATPLLLWRSQKSERSENRLYYGDNLPILGHLLQDSAVQGKVRLIYIDPPYATKSVFRSRSQVDAYCDLLAGGHYIEFLRERLILLRELLAEDGAIYIHLDEKMAFHIKVIMDEVFGQRNFRNWITRKKCNPKNYTRKNYGKVSDYILFYTKSDEYVWNRPVDAWTAERAAKEYQYLDEKTGRRYKKVPIHAPGVRNGETGKPWRGMNPPPGKHWQFTPKTLDEMDARGEIYWSPNGNPRRRIYLDDSDGVPVQDIWTEYRDAHNQNIKITGYPTEKNPALISRLIEASSNPGDIVLDCFSGSGTTLAVASQLGRRWIGVDNSPEAIATTLRRFEKGLERMGDFVSKRDAEDEEQQAAEALPLFNFPDAHETGSPLTTQLPSVRVNDFSLLACEPYRGELESDLAQWQKWQALTLG